MPDDCRKKARLPAERIHSGLASIVRAPSGHSFDGSPRAHKYNSSSRGAFTQMRQGSFYSSHERKEVDIEVLLPRVQRGIVPNATQWIKCACVEDEPIKSIIAGRAECKRIG